MLKICAVVGYTELSVVPGLIESLYRILCIGRCHYGDKKAEQQSEFFHFRYHLFVYFPVSI